MISEGLPCGCIKEFINNKWIWIYCDEHETSEENEKPELRKYRKKLMESY
jgi:hypothetical protein